MSVGPISWRLTKALAALAGEDLRKARVVELRFFGVSQSRKLPIARLVSVSRVEQLRNAGRLRRPISPNDNRIRPALNSGVSLRTSCGKLELCSCR